MHSKIKIFQFAVHIFLNAANVDIYLTVNMCMNLKLVENSEPLWGVGPRLLSLINFL